MQDDLRLCLRHLGQNQELMCVYIMLPCKLLFWGGLRTNLQSHVFYYKSEFVLIWAKSMTQHLREAYMRMIQSFNKHKKVLSARQVSWVCEFAPLPRHTPRNASLCTIAQLVGVLRQFPLG